MKTHTLQLGRIFAIVAGLVLGMLAPDSRAAVPQKNAAGHLTDTEIGRLKELAADYHAYQKKHQILESSFQAEKRMIEGNSELSAKQKQDKMGALVDRLMTESNTLVVKHRQPVVNELNRIASNSATAPGSANLSRAPITESLGTKVGEKGFRGHWGDVDAEAGALTVQRLSEAAKILGDEHGQLIKARKGKMSYVIGPKGLVIHQTPAYISIEGGLNLTVHASNHDVVVKAGSAPFDDTHLKQIGSSTYQQRIEAGASLHETYLSEGMQKNQLGISQVATQDHMKKAAEGLTVDAQALLESRNEERLQSLAKGTLKSLDTAGLSDAELKKILKQSGNDISPSEFRRQLTQLKSGYNRAPLAAGITSDNIKTFQETSRLALQRCDQVSQQQFDNAVISRQKEINASLEEARILDATDRTRAQELRQQANRQKGELIDSKQRYHATRDVNRSVLEKKIDFSASSSEFTRTPSKAGYDRAGIPTSEKIKGLTIDQPHSSNRAWSGPVPDPKVVNSRFWSNTGELSKKGMQAYFAYDKAMRIYESGDKTAETLKTLVELIPGFYAAKKYREGAPSGEVWKEIARELNPTAEMAEMITAKSSELMKESFSNFKQNEFVAGAYNNAVVTRKADGSAEVVSINNVPMDMVFSISYTQGTINGAQAKEDVVKRLKQSDPELNFYQSQLAALKASNEEISKLESKGQLTESQQQEGMRKRLENYRNIEKITKQVSFRERQFDKDDGFVGEQFKKMLEHQYMADLKSFETVRNIANRDKSYETDDVAELAGSKWVKDRGQEIYQKSCARFEKQLAEADEGQKKNLEMIKDDIIFNHFRKLMDSGDHDEGKRVYSASTRLTRIEEAAEMEAQRIYRNSGAGGETSVDNDRYFEFQRAMKESLVKKAILGDSESARENYRKSQEYQELTSLHQGLKLAGIEEKVRKERCIANAIDQAMRWCEKNGIPTDEPDIINNVVDDILHERKDNQKVYYEEFRAKRAQKAMLDGNKELALRILKIGQEAKPDCPTWGALIKAVENDQWPDAAQMARLVTYLPKDNAVGVDKTIDVSRAIANGDKDAALAIIKDALGENPGDALWQGLQKSLEGWDETLLPMADLEQLWTMLTDDAAASGTNSGDALAALFVKEGWGATLGVAKPKPPTEVAGNKPPTHVKPIQTPPSGSTLPPTGNDDDPVADRADRPEVAAEVAVVPYVEYGIPAGASKREAKGSDGSRSVAYMLQNEHICTLRWYPNGNQMSEEYWISSPDPKSNGRVRSLRHGVWKSWNKEGVLISVMGYDRERRHGVMQEFDDSGLPRREEVYSLGKLHGYHKSWESGGKLSRKQLYQQGAAHGAEQRWHPNGRLAYEAHYRNGELHGVTRQWTPEGVLCKKCQYQNGKQHGMSYEYYEASGAPRLMLTYRDGLKYGISRYYSLDNYPSGYSFQLQGEDVDVNTYLAARAADSTLPAVPEPPTGEGSMQDVENQQIAGKEFPETLPNGKRAVMYFRGKYDLAGVRVWHANGKLHREIPVSHHYRHGTHKEWDESGKPTYLQTFNYGKPFGLRREFREGVMTAEYRLIGEVHDGEGKQFDRTTGALTRSYTCKLGELSVDESFDRETGNVIRRDTWDLDQGAQDPAAMVSNGQKRPLFSCSTRPSSHFTYDPKTKKLTSESHYDANNVRTGVWRSFTADGLPIEETEYSGEVTRSKYFAADGTPEREESLKRLGSSIVKHGQLSYWIQQGEHKGKLASVQSFQDGKKHGIHKVWDHKTYKLTTDETYENDLLHGKCKRYHGSGQLTEEVEYVQGKMEGPFKSYWHNGNLKSEGTYKDGKAEGWFSNYLFGSGTLDTRSHCRNGKVHGPVISYDEKGAAKSVRYWLNGGHAGEDGYREARKKDQSLPAMIEVK